MFGRKHLDTDILCQVQKASLDSVVVYAIPSAVLIQSLEHRVLGKKEGVAPLM